MNMACDGVNGGWCSILIMFKVHSKLYNRHN